MKKEKTLRQMFAAGCLIGALCFTAIYGIKILDITYLDWIYIQKGEDIIQHQTGFEFFINDSWHFPLGGYNNLLYPNGTSVVYTDSIPLLAIICKLFRVFLPEHFQYLGLWGFISFALQGGISAAILDKLVKHKAAALASLPMFICSFTVIQRMFGHTALGGQWIVTLALAAFFYSDSFASLRAKVLIWIGITSLSVLIHAYFLPMTGVIMLFSLIEDSIKTGRHRENCAVFISSAAASLAVFYIIGGFSSNGSFDTAGVGEYSMNINALFNSQGRSRIFPGLPLATNGQYEGFMFLGAGMLVIMAICAVKLIFGHREIKKLFTLKVWMSVCIITVLFVAALSPVITFGGTVFANLLVRLPVLGRLFAPFRSTGRLFWPAFYLIQFGLIAFICRGSSHQKLIFVILASCCVLQIWDMQDFIASRREKADPDAVYVNSFENELSSAGLEYLLNRTGHIYYLSDSGANYEDLAITAVHRGITLSNGYTARRDSDMIRRENEKAEEELKSGRIRKEIMYVIAKDYRFIPESIPGGKVKELSDYIVVYAE